MTAEAEKVITMSLTKMAESRGIRRGGTSLHKHLLISSVLTKARSAYYETWCTVEGPYPPRPSGAPTLIPISDESSTEDEKVTERLLESRGLFQLDGTEMDLPRDILNCVEKMSGIPDNIGFSIRETVTSLDESGEEDRARAELILADFVNNLDEDEVDSPSKSFTYLDLDQTGIVPNVDINSTTLGQQLLGNTQSSSPLKSKRRRQWDFALDESDDEDFDEENQFLGQSKRFRFAISENYSFRQIGQSKGTTTCLMSISTTSNTNGNYGNLNTTGHKTQIRTPLEPFFTFKGSNFNFRTKKNTFDEVDDEPEASPFVFDEDYESYEEEIPLKTKNDRRVPSSNGSSSSSSSDEEHETESTAMEVDMDKITNLVQYFSFSKKEGGLVRSVSTPDLCARSISKSSELVGDSKSTQSNTTTKDLYSAYTNSHHHHRILTMTV